MMRRQTFRQGDLRRAIKSVLSGGLKVQRVDVDAASGKFSIFTGESVAPENLSELEAWRKRRDARSA